MVSSLKKNVVLSGICAAVPVRWRSRLASLPTLGRLRAARGNLIPVHQDGGEVICIIHADAHSMDGVNFRQMAANLQPHRRLRSEAKRHPSSTPETSEIEHHTTGETSRLSIQWSSRPRENRPRQSAGCAIPFLHERQTSGSYFLLHSITISVVTQRMTTQRRSKRLGTRKLPSVSMR